MPLRVTRIDHVSVLVTDVARARAFYGGVLGLTEIPPPKEFDFVAVWYDLGGQYLHLLKKPVADTESPRHFCLHVADAAAARAELRANGPAVISAATEAVIGTHLPLSSSAATADRGTRQATPRARRRFTGVALGG